jgi:chromosome segregation ATPase
MMKRIGELNAENARLKAEVERLTSDLQMEKENEDRLVREWQKANNEVYGLQTQVAALIDDQTSLKAEVERLTEINATLALRYDATNSMLDGCAKTIEEMEAHIERLTKAGDNLEDILTDRVSSQEVRDATRQWDDAKSNKAP